jgi:hypothetical protein
MQKIKLFVVVGLAKQNEEYIYLDAYTTKEDAEDDIRDIKNISDIWDDLRIIETEITA